MSWFVPLGVRVTQVGNQWLTAPRLLTVVWVHTGLRLCIAVDFLALHAVMQFVLIQCTYTSVLMDSDRCAGSLQTIDFMPTYTGCL